MKILRETIHHEDVSYSLVFDFVGMPGGSLWFPCDQNGVIAELKPMAEENLAACRHWMSTHNIENKPHIERYVNRWKEPRVGECECGEEVELDSFTNTCDKCERDYNSFGQELAPRECWGEECNETAADIMRPGDPWEGNDY